MISRRQATALPPEWYTFRIRGRFDARPRQGRPFVLASRNAVECVCWWLALPLRIPTCSPQWPPTWVFRPPLDRLLEWQNDSQHLK